MRTFPQGRQQSLDWTGLDSSGLDWKRSSATQTPNSIGLGWKMSSKNKYNFVALSLQLVGEEWNTNCTWKSRRSHVKIPWTTRLEKIVSNTDAVNLFLLWKVTKSSSLLKKKEKWLPSLSMGDRHSEVTIMPLEDLDFLQHQFLLPGW